MRTIDPKFAKVVLGALREAFLEFISNNDQNKVRLLREVYPDYYIGARNDS